ncbi:MAG: DUF2851 family protein [Bacteroidaceae bacterium]|nr:DUF2851 family protein [Bacteroidaceae bacterium]
MENLLHYTWKHKLFPLAGLKTIDGQEVEVLDVGLQNTDAGPDFFNAKVSIGGTTWVGNVELHLKASDWFLHHHDEDERYDSIILHVVEDSDAIIHRKEGAAIPQLVLHIPDAIRARYQELLTIDKYPPCYQAIGDLSNLMIHSFLSSLLVERLKERCEQIRQRYEEHELNWDDALFCTLAHNFGFGVNGAAFDAWARTIPFRAVDHHRDNLRQVEALFFGQAGMLDLQILPPYYRESVQQEPYYQELCSEYSFLKHKFGLKPISPSLWKLARMRPDNSPFVRMAQLAMLYHNEIVTSRNMLDAPDKDALCSMLRCTASSYWDTHYIFGSTPTGSHPKQMSDSTLELLLINTAAPFLFAYGHRKNLPEYCDKAVSLLEQLPAENNFIIRNWRDCGLSVNNAADTQSLIHLKRNYCERKDCLRCRIGYQYLKRAKDE